MKNKEIGAKVEVKTVLICINQVDKWKDIKKVAGIIVEKDNYEHYYHTCNGNYENVSKHLIKNDVYKTFAIKLNDGIKDIEGNNIIIVRDFDLNFLEKKIKKIKPVTEKQYENAQNIIKRYRKENCL